MPHRQPAADRRRSRRRSPGAAARRALRAGAGGTCVAALSVLVGLLVWTLLPVALGARATVVLSGSMAPALRPGDVVVATPVQAGDVQAGRVIWFTDPTRPGRTLLHRVAAVEPDGTVVTRGDANATDDAAPVPPDAVLGLPRLRVPAVGLPVLWATQQRWAQVAAAVLGLALVTRGALWVLAPQPRAVPVPTAGGAR